MTMPSRNPDMDLDTGLSAGLRTDLTTQLATHFSADLSIELAGETVLLLPERAVWWPRRRTLLVADVHLGKAATFRHHGLPVPAGSTDEDLARLDACLQRHAAERLLCLGDLTHAAVGQTMRLHERLDAWRQSHAQLSVELVRGNHDRHAGVPAALRVVVHEDALQDAPFVFCHDLEDVAPDEGSYRLAGHVHPGVLLEARGDRLRLPCFHFGADAGLLPAFGSFTGLHVLTPAAGERCYPVTPDGVLGPVPV